MTLEQKRKFFWQQYHGEVKAIDLPLEYKQYDKRIYCCNEECFVRGKCELFTRYLDCCKVFGRSVSRGCIEDAKGRWKRNIWEQRANKVNYMNASFGFFAKQHGVEPCEHFIKRKE